MFSSMEAEVVYFYMYVYLLMLTWLPKTVVHVLSCVKTWVVSYIHVGLHTFLSQTHWATAIIKETYKHTYHHEFGGPVLFGTQCIG